MLIVRGSFIRLALLGASVAGAGGAQAPAASSAALPPIRALGKPSAVSKDLLGAVSQVRALPGGRVLVNDNLGRKVVMFDPTLASYTIVADTTSATANAYSSRAAGLIAYKGDSTLFVDPQSLSMLVIDGKGQVGRVMSIPRPNDAGALIGGPNGTPGFDASGRLVYRAVGGIRLGGPGRGGDGGRGGAGGERVRVATPAAAPGAFPIPEFPDSTAIIRIDMESRAVDTVAKVKIPKQNMQVTQRPDGGMSINAIMNPMQYVDDWAVTSDGRVAVVRGQEYRVDWMGEGNTVASSSKLPFAWQQLSDSAKTAFLDSTRTAMEKLREQAMARMQAGGAGAPIVMGGPPGGGAAVAQAFTFEMRAGAELRSRGDAPAGRAAGPGGATQMQVPPIQLVGANELPDYAPPFAVGSVRGDADGNVWIRTSHVYDGGSVYDIVNSKGMLTDRVLLPAGRVIAGFGPGVVYMGFRDGEGVRLEAAPIRAQP
ncbi:MAG: hypothetical protein P3A28_01785 [Gemmatimonadota bacterium]|nr:hypothetical protein [Gemmatimonadota bacterium]